MAEALKIKVDIDVFKDTLTQLGDQLVQLRSQKDRLQTETNKLNGETFSGSEVQKAKELAEDALKRVDKAIEKVEAQKKAIEDYLAETHTESSAFQSNIEKVRENLPDLFA